MNTNIYIFEYIRVVQYLSQYRFELQCSRKCLEWKTIIIMSGLVHLDDAHNNFFCKRVQEEGRQQVTT
jgi:hypothetical protein